MLHDYKLDMERRGLTPASIRSLQTNLQAFTRWLPCPLQDATTEQVETFIDTRRARGGGNVSARTRYCWLSCLHGFYTWAVAHGRAEVDPTATITRPKLRPLVPRPVTDDDLHTALTAAPRDMYAMLVLAAYCGLRVAEIAGLTRDGILEDTETIRVLGKGRKERVVPMPPIVQRALRSYGLPRTGPVFTRPMGGAWPSARLSRVIALYLQDVGVDATAHQFRHWYGSRTYAVCRDIVVVQHLMGHSSPTVTAGYVAFSRTVGTDAVWSLPGAA